MFTERKIVYLSTMAQSKKNKKGVVYSTNPDYQYNYGNAGNQATLPPQEQLLYISRDRKNRRGKEATLVEGFVGKTDDLKALAKTLKAACGVGGNAKDGYIILQGDHKNKLKELLEGKGYRVKLKGG